MRWSFETLEMRIEHPERRFADWMRETVQSTHEN